MSKLNSTEANGINNACARLRETQLGTHIKSLEDFVNQGVLATRANDVTAAINELYGMIVNNDCATIQIPPPGFFTIFGDDETGKLYCYYNDEQYPPVFRHVETPGELEGTLYLYIADPEGENNYELEIGHYIAVRHLDNYYTKTQCDTKYPVTVEQLATATAGYAESYVVKQNGVQVGATINIPKDFFTKGGTVRTVTTANQPVNGFAVGDKYLDLEINVDDGTQTTKHMYINVKDLADVYTADEVTITLSNNNVFSIKAGGVGATQLASNAVETAKIKDSNVTTAKIADGAVTNAKVDSITKAKISDFSHSHGSLANGGTLNSDISSVNKVAVTDSSNNLKTISNLPAGKVSDATAHSQAINTAANATQAAINTAVDTAIKNVDDKCNDIVAGDIDLSGTHTHTKSQITDFPTTMTPTSHTHGNITNDGKVGNAANIPLITGTNGVVQASSFGTAANTFCQGNDSRLSNTRTPTFNNIGASSTSIKNLNDYKTGGFYYISNDVNSPYVINCPNSMGTSTPYSANKSFFLLVETWGTTSTYVKQTLTYYNSNDTYTRTCSNNTWSAWALLSKNGHTHSYLPLAGGTLTGGVKHPQTRIATQDSDNLPWAGALTYDTNFLTTTKARKSLLGTLTDGSKWWNVISVRHRNGTGDGNEWGMYIKSKLTENGDLIWQQDLNGATSSEKTILDSSNYSTYANKYTHPSYTARTGKPTGNQTPGFGGSVTISQITSDASGHVTGATDRTITIPSATATQSANGLMSSTDKTKLDGVATGATKNTVSNSLTDTSTTNALSAAQGKALNEKINAITTDNAAVTTVTSLQNSWTGTVRRMVLNGWAIITFESLTKASTTSSYDNVCDTTFNNKLGHVVYAFGNLNNPNATGCVARVNASGYLQARCLTANHSIYGHIVFPVD